MLDRHVSDGQTDLVLKLFCTWKTYLQITLHSDVADVIFL